MVIDPMAQHVELPSGLQLGFSYKGRPVDPSTALTISRSGSSASELGIWQGGLAMFCLLMGELEG